MERVKKKMKKRSILVQWYYVPHQQKTHLKISKMVSLPNVTTPKSEMVRLLNASKLYNHYGIIFSRTLLSAESWL